MDFKFQTDEQLLATQPATLVDDMEQKTAAVLTVTGKRSMRRSRSTNI